MSGHGKALQLARCSTLDCTTRSNLLFVALGEQRQMSTLRARCMDSVGTLWHRVGYYSGSLVLCWPPQAGGARTGYVCVGRGPGARDRTTDAPHCR